MRTFQFSDAKSHKFWNVEVRGNDLVVNYGKIGTQGQTQTKSFASAAQAQGEHDKLVREKLKKGYRETTAAAASASPPTQTLEAAILANPDDTAAHAAYADLLMEAGDPRGEFIQVQLALEDESLSAAERKKLQKREKELLKKHQQEWVGDWAELAPAEKPRWRGDLALPGPQPFRFVRGILAEVNIGRLTVNCARAFRDAPQTRMVRHLAIGEFARAEEDEFEPGRDTRGGDPDIDDPPCQFVLLRWPGLANVRLFQLGWGRDDVGHSCHIDGEYASDFVKQMPLLEELYLFAHNVDTRGLFSLRLPNLRILQVDHSKYYKLAQLAKNSTLKRLTHLRCHPHALDHYDEEPYIRLPDLRALVHSPHLTSLTHLRLRLTDVGDKGCNEIVKSDILKRLKVLDLAQGSISDAGAEILASSPDLAHLELLDLSCNALTQKGIRALKKTGVSLVVKDQHKDSGEFDPDDGDMIPMYLFQGDME